MNYLSVSIMCLMFMMAGVKAQAAPTGTFSCPESDPTTASMMTVSLGFDVPVTGLSLTDLVTTNSRVINLSGSGASYQFTLYPKAPGLLEVVLPAGSVQDTTGTSNVVAASFSRLFDGWPQFVPWIDLSLQGWDMILYGGRTDDMMASFSGDGGMTVGDFNGDGIADLLIGSTGGDGPNDSRIDCGEAAVVFGSAEHPAVMDSAGTDGPKPDLIIYGADNYDHMCENGPILAGDLNNDGYDDMIIGAINADGPGNGRVDGGEVYIIFGRDQFTSTTLDMAAGQQSVTIYGATADNWLGRFGDAMKVGDVNGDGYKDLVIGNYLENKTYIIYGRATWPATIDLAGQQNVTITGGDWPTAYGSLALGDFNGDGKDDIAIGEPRSAGSSAGGAGRVYVILGSATLPSTINCPGGGANMIVYGSYANEWVSCGAIKLADLDLDGKDDIILGSTYIGSGYPAGKVYVIYGRSSVPASIDLASNQQDLLIQGAHTPDALYFNDAVRVGNFNGDSYLDLAVSAPVARGPNNDRPGAGEVYLIFGAATRRTGTINLGSHQENAIIYGRGSSDLGVSGIADVNHDNIDDLICNETLYGGKTYIFYGQEQWPASYDVVTSTPETTIYDSDECTVIKTGDFNGDLVDDIAIGERDANGPGGTRSSAGEVNIIYGHGAYQATGDLRVYLSPAAAVTAGAQWRRVGTATWLNSGVTESDVAPGTYQIQFKPLANYDSPSTQTVTVNAPYTSVAAGTYVHHTGTLCVTISPADAVSAGAAWSIDAGTTWHQSGEIVTVPTGSYTVRFKILANWTIVPDQQVVIAKDQQTVASTSYGRAGSLHVVISPAEVVSAGARWRRAGTSTWLESNVVETNIPVAQYQVEFKSVPLWSSLVSQVVDITDSHQAEVTGTYVRLAVTASLNSAAVNPLGGPFPVVASFSEPVSGFTAGDLITTNCTVSRVYQPRLTSLSASIYGNAAIKPDGSLINWGYMPTVPAGNDYVAVTNGSHFGVAIRSDGSLTAWGDNNYGQCNVPSGNDFVMVSAGAAHVVAIRRDGSLVAWGLNSDGQCNVPAGNNFKDVKAFSNSNLALRWDGTLAQWGYILEFRAPAGNDYIGIAPGLYHWLALKKDGTIVSWGHNSYGECTPPSGRYVGIGAGNWFSVGLRSDGSLVAFGRNMYNKLNVPSGNDFISVICGRDYCLALRSDGTIASWGNNDCHQLNTPAGLTVQPSRWSDFIFDVVPTDLGHTAAYIPACVVTNADSLLNQASNVLERDYEAMGSLKVNLMPASAVSAGAMWRRMNTTTWLAGGATETWLPVGQYGVEFKPVTAWTAPTSTVLTVNFNQVTETTHTYSQMGRLCVTLGPANAVTQGARWRRVGTTTWLASGATEVGLADGPCTVEFKPVAGWSAPANAALTIAHDTLTQATGTYVLLGSLKVNLLPTAAVSQGGRWRRGGTSTWMAGGATEIGLSAGQYQVVFNSIAGYATPTTQTLSIALGQLTETTGTYALQPLTVNLASTAANPVDDRFPARVVFSERVSGFSRQDVQTTNCTIHRIIAKQTRTISSGAWHNLAIQTNGTVAAWGWNGSGVGSSPGSMEFVTVHAGEFHNIGVLADQSLYAWGLGSHGECSVPAGNDFIDAAAGGYHSVALRTDGTIIGFGSNEYGQAAAPSGYFTAIACGENHSLALRADGGLAAWGSNVYGLTDVPAGNDFVKISAGLYHNLALRADGSLIAWGRETSVPPGNDFVAISAGAFHSLALRSDGSIVGWGQNAVHECDVPAENDFVAIAAGMSFSTALRADGSVVAWGGNGNGQCTVPTGLSALQPWIYECMLDVQPTNLGPVSISIPNDVVQGVHLNYNLASNVLTRTYRRSGGLQMTVQPSGAATQARWRRVGTTNWFNSGATESDLLIGSYTVEFAAVQGYTRPVSQTVAIAWNQTTQATATYQQITPRSTTWLNFAWSGAEDGTQAQPYNTLIEGLDGTQSGGTIKALAGPTPEHYRITQPVRIEAVGGPVRIGAH